MHIPQIELVHLAVYSTSFFFLSFSRFICCFRLSTSLAIYSNVINVNDECVYAMTASLKCESLIKYGEWVAAASLLLHHQCHHCDDIAAITLLYLTTVVYRTLWPIKYDLICICWIINTSMQSKNVKIERAENSTLNFFSFLSLSLSLEWNAHTWRLTVCYACDLQEAHYKFFKWFLILFHQFKPGRKE